jgi:nucleotide-binding universal stress UspA family protein
MFRTIVAGTDAHQKGRNAVSLAHELAWGTNARLLLVAVHRHRSTQPAELVRRLRALRNELAPEALVLTVPDASPANALRRIAEEQRADLIVVGARQRSRLRRVVEGQPGMQVLRAAPCAVAVAPDDASRPQHLGRIGVWAGETSESAAALDLADSLARCSGGRVRTLESVDGGQAPLDLLVLASRDTGTVRQLVHDARCPVLVPPREKRERRAPEAQTSAART